MLFPGPIQPLSSNLHVIYSLSFKFTHYLQSRFFSDLRVIYMISVRIPSNLQHLRYNLTCFASVEKISFPTRSLNTPFRLWSSSALHLTTSCLRSKLEIVFPHVLASILRRFYCPRRLFVRRRFPRVWKTKDWLTG